MIISSLQKTSLIDYPEKICCIVFTSGCNFRCHFCHNPILVNKVHLKIKQQVAEDEFWTFLKSRKGLLDGVSITGGEPTLFPDLPDFIAKIHELGFLVKLDSNGTNPKMLQHLIDNKLIDYVAMDIKGSLKKYAEIVNVKLDIAKIAQSINLILAGKINYEFRTTVLPKFHDIPEMHQIGQLIRGAKNYYLQQFRPTITLNPSFRWEKSYSVASLTEMAKLMQQYVGQCIVRS